MTQGSCKSATRSQIDSEAFCQAVAVSAKCESRGYSPVLESGSCVCVRACVSMCVTTMNTITVVHLGLTPAVLHYHTCLPTAPSLFSSLALFSSDSAVL